MDNARPGGSRGSRGTLSFYHGDSDMRCRGLPGASVMDSGEPIERQHCERNLTNPLAIA
jgi:hypothetical protein